MIWACYYRFIKNFFKNNRFDIFAILTILLTLPLFFYKLGQTSLTSWDEGWYAQIARNVLTSGNLFHLTWNGLLYNDHPPAGFWFIATSFNLFGISNLTDRLPSALAGLGCLITIYFLGKQLFNKYVGLASAISLASCFWFINRSRSGDLDIFLTLFFLSTIFFAIKARLNTKFLIPFSISMAFLSITKSLVPFTIIPALIVIWWGSDLWKKKQFWIAIGLSMSLFIIWFVEQNFLRAGFLQRYLNIGFPQSDAPTPISTNIKTTLAFIHDGVGKWYWPGLASIILGLLTRKKSFLILSVFFLTFLAPFALSNKGQLWHLIPLYPILLLSFFGFFYFILEKIIFIKKYRPFIIYPAIFLVCLYLSLTQIKQMWVQFIDIPAFISDEEILSKEAGKYPVPFFIDGDFVPTAVFYSNKVVAQTWGGGIPDMFTRNKSFVLITKQYRLDGAHIPPTEYTILKQDRDKILILKKG